MNFLEKLDFLMNKYDLNKRTLSLKSNIPYTTIDGWYKKGYEGLKLTTLRKLNDFFNTTLDYWILDEITDPNYGKTSGFKVDYSEMEHVKKYRSLDPYGQETVSYILNREVKRVSELTELKEKLPNVLIEIPENHDPVRYISYHQRLASAGNGQVVFEDMPVDRIEIPDIPKYKRVSYAIGVNGQSMEPLYSDGDILLIEPTCQVEIGEIGIFIVDGEAFVKKLGDGELISLNKGYPNITLTEYSNCMGRVVDKLCQN